MLSNMARYFILSFALVSMLIGCGCSLHPQKEESRQFNEQMEQDQGEVQKKPEPIPINPQHS